LDTSHTYATYDDATTQNKHCHCSKFQKNNENSKLVMARNMASFLGTSKNVEDSRQTNNLVKKLEPQLGSFHIWDVW
jgi:hypothetical protein